MMQPIPRAGVAPSEVKTAVGPSKNIQQQIGYRYGVCCAGSADWRNQWIDGYF
jgi:hypothetical protein